MMRRECRTFLCAALFFAGMAAFAGAGDTANKTLSIRYEATVGDHSVFPDGCETPYKDINSFVEFYESTIAELVLDKGPHVKGVADLFAISELRAEMKDLFPNLSEESPLDRLLVSQLCAFQRVRLQQMKPGKMRPQAIASGDVDLHKHFQDIAHKLYKDCRGLLVDALAQQAKLRERMKLLALRKSDLRVAREAGRALIDDILPTEQAKKGLK